MLLAVHRYDMDREVTFLIGTVRTELTSIGACTRVYDEMTSQHLPSVGSTEHFVAYATTNTIE